MLRDRRRGPSWHFAVAIDVRVPVPGRILSIPATQDIPDPPGLLYVKGTFEPRDQLAIAVVGSRHCTPYGARLPSGSAGSLARTGFTVVSGLARHRRRRTSRCAQAGGRTLAVLANGLASVYPPEHEDLARSVVEAGVLISEMPMHQPARRSVYPAKPNYFRPVAGRGGCGSHSTERFPLHGHHAMEQNREVFAVPGPVDSLASRGCHRLIRDGARLVETVDDILEELGPLIRRGPDRSLGAAGPPSGRAGTFRQRTVAAGTSRQSAGRRRRLDHPHGPDRGAGHGDA